MSKKLVAYFSASGTTRRIAQMIAEAGACDLSACPLRRLHLVAADLHGAGTKGRRDIRPQHLEIFVGAYRIDRTYGRVQVIHVGLHATVIGIDLFRARPSLEGFALTIHAKGMTFPPLRECPAEIFGGDNVLPLYP